MALQLSDIGNIGSLLSAVASGVAAFYAYKAIRTQNNSLAYASNVLAMNEFIMNIYVNRKPITYGPKGKRADFLADRERARKAFLKDPAAWRSKCLANLPEDETDEALLGNRRVADEIAHSLQHLGLSVFTGVVPLKLLLASNGDGLILDWLVVKNMVDDLRRSKGMYSMLVKSETVYARRRHAEWLALVAFLWLRKNWHYAELWDNALNRILEAPYYKDIQQIELTVSRITAADKGLFASQTREEVLELIGLEI